MHSDFNENECWQNRVPSLQKYNIFFYQEKYKFYKIMKWKPQWNELY